MLVVWSSNYALALHLILVGNINAISSIYSLSLRRLNVFNSRWRNCNHASRDSSLHHVILEAKSRIRSVVAWWSISVMTILHQMWVLVVMWLMHIWQMGIRTIYLVICKIIHCTSSCSKNSIHCSRTSIVVCICQMLMECGLSIMLMKGLSWNLMRCQVSSLSLH